MKLKARFTAICSIAFQTSLEAMTYDAAGDFSHANNPNGAWSYGYDDGTFHLFTHKAEIASGVFFWQGLLNGPLGEPTAGENEGSAVLVINATTTYAPGQFTLHPGRNGQRAVLRWTAPEDETYSVAALFRGQDTMTTSDASIRWNGSVVGTAEISGHAVFEYFSEFALAQDDTIDFVVGWGSNGTFYFDTTGVDAIISNPPDPVRPEFPNRNTDGLPVIFLNWAGDPGPYGDGSHPPENGVPEPGSSVLLLLSMAAVIATDSGLKSRFARCSRFARGSAQSFFTLSQGQAD